MVCLRKNARHKAVVSPYKLEAIEAWAIVLDISIKRMSMFISVEILSVEKSAIQSIKGAL